MTSPMTTQTVAEQLAALLDGDGLRWTARNGRTFEAVVEEMGGARTEWRDGWRTGDVVRYTFDDGSVITAAGAAWDLGYPDCFCWEGAGHDCHTLREC